MKKFCSILISLILFPFFIIANPANGVNEFVLENGLTVFLLEDSSDALIHLELEIRAGFSNQTPQNTGFFTLLANLINKSNPQIDFSMAEVTADTTKFKITSTPLQIERQISLLADAVFKTQFSDDLIIQEMDFLKKEVTENAASMSYLINSAIDSKVFIHAPWQQDSGIYPALFKKSTLNQTRAQIQEIQNNWYLPQRTALFISGNINSERLTTVIKNTFGKYYSNVQNKTPVTIPAINNQKKYVIHDEEFSKDLTQIVVQYTFLNMEQADLMANTLNNRFSTFKNRTLEIPELNIPGDEYINVSQAHKNNSTRLIFQTLVQSPENKKIKTNSIKQTLKFIEEVQKIPESMQFQEFQFAKNQMNYDFQKICSSSSVFMENLADFWAILPYSNYFVTDENSSNFEHSVTTAKMFSRPNLLAQTDFTETINQFKSEEPFVFVIINSKDFKNNKKEYLAQGFEEINSKNSSWYMQKLYQNQRDLFKPDSFETTGNRNSIDNNYYSKNKSKIKTTTLENGITISTKRNPNSTGISLLINVKGGKYYTASDNGFEEVMVNLLGTLIQREIYAKKSNGIILGTPEVTVNTDIFTSQILINCDAIDFEAVCSSVSNSLIYSEIPPAAADRAVSNRQYKKRLENGSAVTQLQAAAISMLYPNSDFSKIFEAKEEVLQDTTYIKILTAYPELLDASKYDFIVCGDFNSHEEISNIISKNFSQLENKKDFSISQVPSPVFSRKSASAKLIHTFLTDIPAEKAGPQPAVLIPTTEFLDPVIFYLKAPENLEDAAIFNAILNYLQILLKIEISENPRIKNTEVQIQLPKSQMPFGTIIFTNVKYTKEIDATYKSAIESFNSQINMNKNDILNKIKDYWLTNQMEGTSSNLGTALLMQKGMEYFPNNHDVSYYLKECNIIQNATLQDFQKLINSLNIFPDFKICSKDSK